MIKHCNCLHGFSQTKNYEVNDFILLIPSTSTHAEGLASKYLRTYKWIDMWITGWQHRNDICLHCSSLVQIGTENGGQ